TLHGAQLVSVGLPFLLRNADVKEAASTSAIKGGELVVYEPLRFRATVDSMGDPGSDTEVEGEAPTGGELVLFQPLELVAGDEGVGTETCQKDEAPTGGQLVLFKPLQLVDGSEGGGSETCQKDEAPTVRYG
ncbi:unnamed protein product, partial [Ectocarpus fasciculatus]